VLDGGRAVRWTRESEVESAMLVLLDIENEDLSLLELAVDCESRRVETGDIDIDDDAPQAGYGHQSKLDVTDGVGIGAVTSWRGE
jgi:hypothetical protein